MKEIIMKEIINKLRKANKCWDFFNIQKEHILESTNSIRKTIKNINQKGFSDLSDLISISEKLDIIENQMPDHEKKQIIIKGEIK